MVDFSVPFGMDRFVQNIRLECDSSTSAQHSADVKDNLE